MPMFFPLSLSYWVSISSNGIIIYKFLTHWGLSKIILLAIPSQVHLLWKNVFFSIDKLSKSSGLAVNRLQVIALTSGDLESELNV